MGFYAKENADVEEHATTEVQKIAPLTGAVADTADAIEDLSKNHDAIVAVQNAGATAITCVGDFEATRSAFRDDHREVDKKRRASRRNYGHLKHFISVLALARPNEMLFRTLSWCPPSRRTAAR